MTFSKANSGEYMAALATDAYLESIHVVEFADALVAEWEGASNIRSVLGDLRMGSLEAITQSGS